MASVFENVPAAPADVIFALTADYKADTFADKVNLGVGAYRTEEGKPWVLPVVHKVNRTFQIRVFSLHIPDVVIVKRTDQPEAHGDPQGGGCYSVFL
ncbi:Aspartate aminotransferase, cytoplasmic, partial [Entomortierella chlamydospora]